MDWEPWDSDPSAETALSKDEWQAIGITCRIAYSINLKTRAELVAMPVDLGPDAFMDFHGEIAASLAQVEYLRTVLSVAEARLLAAGSTFACQATGRDR